MIAMLKLTTNKKVQKMVASVLTVTCLATVLPAFAGAERSEVRVGVEVQGVTNEEAIPSKGAAMKSNRIEAVKEAVIVDQNALEEARMLLNSEAGKLASEGQGVKEAQGLKGKVLVAILRTGGWLLEKLLKPFSPSKAALVKKYAKQAATALEKIGKFTHSAFVNALVKLGVPKKVAEDIAEIIGFLLF